MKAGYLLFLGMMLGLSACQWGDNKKPKPDITTDTLRYTYKTIKQRAADCGNKPDSGCTVVKIKYPEFTEQEILNDSVRQKINLFGLDNPDKKPDTNLNEISKNFLKNYQEDTAPKNLSGIIYRLDLQAYVLRQDSSLTTIQFEGSIFQGGAHGGYSLQFFNWNTKAAKLIKLDDILQDSYQNRLTSIADTIFRKQEKLSDKASLTPDYFFKDGKFSLPNNFSITPIGIRFFYNEYEIKPYSGGTTDLFIPYPKIKSILKPNTVITQYLK